MAMLLFLLKHALGYRVPLEVELESPHPAGDSQGDWRTAGTGSKRTVDFWQF